MRRFANFCLAAAAVASPAWASKEPIMEARGGWVEEVPLPAPDPALAKAPVQTLLIDSQTRFGENTHELYIRSALLIQTPEGLNGAGTIALPWHPDQTELIVHEVAISRGGKLIDLLGAGAKFTTLRRENNLEQAMLDGTLTAVLQPEGLSVGDILLLSYTMRTKPRSVRFEPEQFLFLPPTVPLRRVRYREVWPEGRSIRWRASPAMGSPKLRKTRLGNELVTELNDVRLPAPPARAPARFMLAATLQLTGYPDWNAVSVVLAPLYTAGASLQAGSPLQAEIGKISAAHPDHRGRALAALRLVQDQIRYVSLAMGEGGYLPASADQTWSRKYGDCKGKTVTLIALLNGLGITAEPVMVSSRFGDALNEHLPQMSLFDHVLVRATIGGQSYLLDGTRSGDRQLDALQSFPFGWGLPVRTVGATLERLPLAPPAEPLTDIETTFDASGSFNGPVPVKAQITFRGDLRPPTGSLRRSSARQPSRSRSWIPGPA